MQLFFASSRLIFQALPEEGRDILAAAAKDKPKAQVEGVRPPPGVDLKDPKAQELAIKQFIETTWLAQDKMKGLKLSENQPGQPKLPKVNPDGSIEQEFSFGDGKLPGKITFPKQPMDSSKPVQIIYNFVGVEGKEDSKFWENIQKKQQDLGNVVLVTVNTPTGQVKVADKDVNFLSALTKDLEQIPNLKAKNILTFANSKDPSFQAAKTIAQEYAAMDSRLKALLPSEDEAALESFLNQQQSVAQPPATPSLPTISSSSRGGGGGRAVDAMYPNNSGGAANPHEGGTVVNSGISNGASTSSAQPDLPLAGNNNPNQRMERNENVSKQFGAFFGDSLMVGAMGFGASLKAPNALNHARVGKFAHEVITDIRGLTKAELESLRGTTVLIGAASNDLLNNKWPLSDLKEAYRLFKEDYKEYDIKVVAYTVPPYGGYHLANYAKNQKRQDLNAAIRELKGTPNGPDEVVDLALPRSQGGMANDQNPDLLAKDFHSADGLHPAATGSNKEKGGYALMASLIQESLAKSSATENPPSAQPGSPEQAVTNLEGTASKFEGYRAGNERYNEQIKDVVINNLPGLGSFQSVRMNINIANFDPNKPTKVLVFATANGRTPEATWGSLAGPESNRYQYMGAQIRKMRASSEFTGVNLVAVCLTPKSTSWTTWENGGKNPNRGAITAALLDTAKSEVSRLTAGQPVELDLSGCSGGGSFIHEYIRNEAKIPDDLNNIFIYDANYGHDSAQDSHRYINWLKNNPSHHLVVVAGDEKNGKQFELLKADFQKAFPPLQHNSGNGFDEYMALNGQIRLVKFHGNNHHGDTVVSGVEYSLRTSLGLNSHFDPTLRDLKKYTDKNEPPAFQFS